MMVDARGHSCPIPVLMVQKAIKAADCAPLSLEVLCDSFAAKENITRYGAAQGYAVSVSQESDDFRLILSR